MMIFSVILLLFFVGLGYSQNEQLTIEECFDKYDRGIYPDAEDCTKFLSCATEDPFDCPAGLHFSPSKLVCDWPADAGCMTDTTPSPDQTSPPEQTEKPEDNSDKPPDSTEPSEKPNENSDKPTDTSDKPNDATTPQSSDKPTDSSDKPTTPESDNKPSDNSDKPDEATTPQSSEKPTDSSNIPPSSDKSSESSDKPSEATTPQSSDEPSDSSDKPSEATPPQSSDKPSESTTPKSSEKPTDSSDKPSEPTAPQSSDKPTDNSDKPPETTPSSSDKPSEPDNSEKPSSQPPQSTPSTSDKTSEETNEPPDSTPQSSDKSSEPQESSQPTSSTPDSSLPNSSEESTSEPPSSESSNKPSSEAADSSTPSSSEKMSEPTSEPSATPEKPAESTPQASSEQTPSTPSSSEQSPQPSESLPASTEKLSESTLQSSQPPASSEPPISSELPVSSEKPEPSIPSESETPQSTPGSQKCTPSIPEETPKQTPEPGQTAELEATYLPPEKIPQPTFGNRFKETPAPTDSDKGPEKPYTEPQAEGFKECLAKYKYGIFAHPEDPSKFYICTKTKPFEMTCPEGLVFHPESYGCDRPTPTTPPPPPKYNLQECLQKYKKGIFPHPSDCQKFYGCSKYGPLEMQCPNGLHFNPMKLVCDWPSRNCISPTVRQRDRIFKAMKKDKIVPDVVDQLPEKLAEVAFPSGGQVDLGKELSPSQTKQPPSIYWDADKNSYYTLCMVDPDAPRPKESKWNQWNHWMVGNIPGNKIQQGDTLTDYMPACPQRNSGPHRYTYLVYKQPQRIQFKEPRIPANDFMQRDGFNMRNFAQKYQLGKPIAGNYFKCSWDPWVPRFYNQIGYNPPNPGMTSRLTNFGSGLGNQLGSSFGNSFSYSYKFRV